MFQAPTSQLPIPQKHVQMQACGMLGLHDHQLTTAARVVGRQSNLESSTWGCHLGSSTEPCRGSLHKTIRPNAICLQRIHVTHG